MLSRHVAQVYYHHHHYPLSSLYSSSAGCQKSTGLTAQALLTHCPTKTFLTIRDALSTTASNIIIITVIVIIIIIIITSL